MADWFAVIYAALGEKDQAFAWLEKAYEERSFFLPFIKTRIEYDPLRSDPSFKKLLKKMGLEK